MYAIIRCTIMQNAVNSHFFQPGGGIISKFLKSVHVMHSSFHETIRLHNTCKYELKQFTVHASLYLVYAKILNFK